MEIDSWRHLAIITAAIPQTMFVITWGLLPWWKDFVGRALFFKSASFAILLDAAAAYIFLEGKYEDATIVGLYWLVALSCWWQFGALLKQLRLAKAIMNSPVVDPPRHRTDPPAK